MSQSPNPTGNAGQLPPNYRALPGSERRAARSARRVGPADPNEKLSVTICVRRRPDGPPMPDLAYWAKNPPGRRKFVSDEEFAQKYGAAQEEIDKVSGFARSQELTVGETHLSRRTVVVTGTVAQMNRAFAVDLGRYESPEGNYRGREGSIHLPNDIADVVVAVLGLDNRKMAWRASNGFNAASSLNPLQVAQYYNFPSGGAAGQYVGVLEFSDPAEGPGLSGYNPGDITAYFTTNQGIGPGLINPVVNNVNAAGPGNMPAPDWIPDSEITLDIEVAGAVAQGAQINVYFTLFDENGWVTGIHRAVHPQAGDPPRACALSISWDAPELITEPSGPTGSFTWTQAGMNMVSSVFQDAAVFGMTVFVASGDNGSDCSVGDGKAHVYYPASDPWVTCCGGTEIGSESGSYAEVTWPNTGGGISDQFDLPAWQQGIGVPPSKNPGGHVGRGIPDIAGYAKGYSISWDGSLQGPFPGTSETAPLYAGLIAVITKIIGEPIGYLNPTLYAFAQDPNYSGLFRDINDGTNNGQNGAPGYTSGPGWDACTGWGVLDGGALLAALQGLFAKGCTFQMDRTTFGRDEVQGLLSAAGGGPANVNPAFWVIVDGFKPADLGITALTNTPPFTSPSQAMLNAWAPKISVSPTVSGMSITPVGVASDDPTLGPEVQRFTFTYEVTFKDLSAFTFAPGQTETVNLTAAIQGLSAHSSIELINEPDPFITCGQTSWLSVDIGVFTIEANGSRFGATMGNSASDAKAFLKTVTDNLTAGQGKVGSNPRDSFDSINPQADSPVYILPTAPGTSIPVFNFAIARVRYQGYALDAQAVRVFFRLFNAQTTDSSYVPPGNYPGTGTFRTWSDGIQYGQKIPLAGVQGGEYVTIPCFAEGRVDTSQFSMTTQPDPLNVKTLSHTGSGPEHDTFYGCLLDINIPTPILPQNPPAKVDGPFPSGRETLLQVITRNPHQCLVAQIAYDLVTIPTGAGPGSTDKLAQRNLSWSTILNPGDVESRRAPETFDIRPTPSTPLGAEKPDEIMIEWGNVPVGTVAQIYLPAVSAAKVLRMAAEMYPTHRLGMADANTLQCTAGGITYIPIPQGGAANYAGLLSVDFPAGVKKGQTYTIVVRQVTNQTGPPPPPPPPPIQIKAATRAVALSQQILWRRIRGTFQITVPVSTKDVALVPEERLLAVLRWIQKSIPTSSRWYPIFLRYVDQIAGRVRGFGGDPNQIPPSPTGELPPSVLYPGGKGHGAEHGHRLGFTGKVVGIIYDRFGDFEGFILETEEGHERLFRGREQEVEELVNRAWVERMVITVFVEHHDAHWPASIVLRRFH